MKMKRQLLLFIAVLFLPWTTIADIPRTADGKPDLSGHYDIATLTRSRGIAGLATTFI